MSAKTEEVNHPERNTAYTQLIQEMDPTRRVLYKDPQQWCVYHKTRGHEMENFCVLRNKIEKLIQKMMLKKYVKNGLPEIGLG